MQLSPKDFQISGSDNQICHYLVSLIHQVSIQNPSSSKHKSSLHPSPYISFLCLCLSLSKSILPKTQVSFRERKKKSMTLRLPQLPHHRLRRRWRRVPRISQILPRCLRILLDAAPQEIFLRREFLLSPSQKGTAHVSRVHTLNSSRFLSLPVSIAVSKTPMPITVTDLVAFV
jgi:hypothetical protein